MSIGFDITETSLRGVKLIQRKTAGDSRGFFERLFGSLEMRSIIGNRNIVEINRSFTAKRGTIRGLHFQRPPNAEFKLVTCLRGKVFDVAVDVRTKSSTFLQWHAEVLTETSYKTFVIPEGFAHGFQTLSDDCEMLYFHSGGYHLGSEGGIHPNDPTVAVSWPLSVAELSSRDSQLPMISKAFQGIVV